MGLGFIGGVVRFKQEETIFQELLGFNRETISEELLSFNRETIFEELLGFNRETSFELLGFNREKFSDDGQHNGVRFQSEDKKYGVVRFEQGVFFW
ncbi:hypothetical protein QR98_0015090 [Sarcoptes scabiei]|uniref:Uncharacterized protein n=1 Tax=Sarcoptes scabiei TaxID=52283 RepID=A0A131ZX61_SARSC|nr:hypothetical protein QR98_0015090 [Sarcoptes scabiei]